MIYLIIAVFIIMLLFSFIIYIVIKNNKNTKVKIGLDFLGFKTYMEVDEQENTKELKE